MSAKLEANCLAELDRKVSGQSETIGARLEADLAVFRPLPSGAFEACEKRTARVSSTTAAAISIVLLGIHLSLRAPLHVERGSPVDFGLAYNEIRIHIVD